MNWIAWNSVRAKALTKSPSDMPSIAFATASSTTAQDGPCVWSPRKPKATIETSVA